jgi:hypothetical protein
MELDAVIKAMEANEQGQTKSAAATDSSVVASAIEKAASAPPAPTADADAVHALLKTANELAGTEKEAEISHAALCGQAFADGAIAKFAAYDAQVQQAELQNNAYVMPKVAADQEEQMYAAAEYGYKLAHDKMAADYQEGHNEALRQVHDLAAAEFVKGAAEVTVLVDLLKQQNS